MFFVLSKFLAPLENPGDILLLMLGVGVILSWFRPPRRLGVSIIAIVTFLFFVITLLPAYVWVAAPLENRFTVARPLPSQLDGIIVLGGAVNPIVTAERGLPALNADAEEMTEFVSLAKAYPHARLVFSGGNSGLFNRKSLSEAAVAKLFFQQQGLDTRRIIFEDRSRNTYENALFSKEIIRPKPEEVWLLVTSALHMPRAVGVFRKVGWPVLAVPVAYKTSDIPGHDFALNLSIIDAAAHEWLGLLAYWGTGKTDTLIPSP
jgi:uncharacterized SAM-binding protein YcdF (DUF218 family)